MIIYKITNLLNNKIYVGADRKNNNEYLGSGIVIRRIVKKYGTINFKKEILEECKSEKQLIERESYWIKELDSSNPDIGYNVNRRHHKKTGGNYTLTSFTLDEFLLKTLKIKLLQYDTTMAAVLITASHMFVSSSDFRELILEKNAEVKHDN